VRTLGGDVKEILWSGQVNRVGLVGLVGGLGPVVVVGYMLFDRKLHIGYE
jgi:hypothetical protein